MTGHPATAKGQIKINNQKFLLGTYYEAFFKAGFKNRILSVHALSSMDSTMTGPLKSFKCSKCQWEMDKIKDTEHKLGHRQLFTALALLSYASNACQVFKSGQSKWLKLRWS